MVALANGSFGGAPPPIRMTGKFYTPHHCTADGQTVTISANLIYYVPFYVPATGTYLGCKFFNSGVGDNGKKVRTAVYSESSTGGPGTLQKDFGEVTLTGASAIRTAASTVTLSGPAWYYLALVSDTTPVLYSMSAITSGTVAGQITASPIASQLGMFTPTIPGASDRIADSTPIGETASFTYGAFNSTATTPTATIFGLNSGTFPYFGLYL